MADTTPRKRTLAPWMGLLLTVLGALSNGLPFIGFPAAPVPWIGLLLSLIGFVVVLLGLWRVFGHRYALFLGRPAHPRRIHSCSASWAAGAGFYAAGQHWAFCLADAVVLWFSGEGAAQRSSPGFLSRILVTLLQPRVTRHRKISTGI